MKLFQCKALYPVCPSSCLLTSCFLFLLYSLSFQSSSVVLLLKGSGYASSWWLWVFFFSSQCLFRALLKWHLFGEVFPCLRCVPHSFYFYSLPDLIFLHATHQLTSMSYTIGVFIMVHHTGTLAP